MNDECPKRAEEVGDDRVLHLDIRSFVIWTRIKPNQSNDPTGLGQEKDDGDLPEKNRHINGLLLEENPDSEINESFHSLVFSVDP